MKKAINHLETELIKIRAGKANPQMIDGIMVDYYGSPMPINQVANISVMDARTLSIQPWEKNMLQPIERGNYCSQYWYYSSKRWCFDSAFSATAYRREKKELVKNVRSEGEHSKIAIRNIRRDAIEHIKNFRKTDLVRMQPKMQKQICNR